MENLFVPYKAEKKLGKGPALVLAPHPDDEIFGCGGALITHVDAEDPVHVVILTDGAFLEGTADSTEYAAERMRESIEASEIIGYPEPEFWHMPDRGLEYSEFLIEKLCNLLGRVQPELIYCPSIYEMHPDHRVAAMATCEAARRSGKHHVIAMYEIGVPLKPNVLLDISDILAIKQKAMACFRSQLKIQRYDSQITALNHYRAFTLGPDINAAEAYRLIDSSEHARDPLEIYESEYRRQHKLGLELVPSAAPKVSVIIRSTGKGFLDETLDSVSLQTHPAVEVILVNALGPGHPFVGEKCGRFPIKFISPGHSLPRSQAANTGLDHAAGDFIMFLDEDDCIFPDHTARLAEALLDNPELPLAYSGVECRRTDAHSSSYEVTHVFNDPFDRGRLLLENYIPIHAAMFRREVMEKGCRFDTALDMHEDWDFWLQLSDINNFFHVDRISAFYRITGSGNSGVWTEDEKIKDAQLKIFTKWWHQWTPKLLQYNFSTLKEKLVAADNELRKAHLEAEQQHRKIHGLLDKSDQQCRILEKQLRKQDRDRAQERKLFKEALDASHKYVDALLNDLSAQLTDRAGELNFITEKLKPFDADAYYAALKDIDKQLNSLISITKATEENIKTSIEANIETSIRHIRNDIRQFHPFMTRILKIDSSIKN